MFGGLPMNARRRLQSYGRLETWFRPRLRCAPAIVALAVVGAACTPGAPVAGANQLPASASECPNTVTGTRMSLEDTPDGIAIRYATTTNAVELRLRAAALAERFSRATSPRFPPAWARVETIPDGVRVVVTARDRANVEALQALVRQHELTMFEGDCTWMSEPRS